MKEDQRVIEKLLNSYRELEENENTEMNTIAFMAMEISRYVSIHDSIQLLEQGIEDLVSGHLTPKLIEVELLTSVLQNMSTPLMEHDLRLCYNNVRDVYNSQNFDVARSGSDLFIRIRVPYSKFGYETEIVSLPVPGRQGWTTRIKGIPSVLIVAQSFGLIGEMSGSLNSSTVS
jgi:hypothetical protein